MSPPFIAHVTDDQILGYIDLVIGDFNLFPPLTGYNSETLKTNYIPIVVFGCQFFSLLFLQMNAVIQDFNYNDNGLTVQVDQTSKVDQSLKNVAEVYKNMVENGKRSEIWNVGPKGIGTPKFHISMGQFLKISLGDSFLWNS